MLRTWRIKRSLKTLDSCNPSARSTAIKSLLNLGSDVIEYFFRNIEVYGHRPDWSKSDEWIIGAIEYMTHIEGVHSDFAVQWITSQLRNCESRVRMSALTALVNRCAVSELIWALDDQTPEVQHGAAKALSKLSGISEDDLNDSMERSRRARSTRKQFANPMERELYEHRHPMSKRMIRNIAEAIIAHSTDPRMVAEARKALK